MHVDFLYPVVSYMLELRANFQVLHEGLLSINAALSSNTAVNNSSL